MAAPVECPNSTPCHATHCAPPLREHQQRREPRTLCSLVVQYRRESKRVALNRDSTLQNTPQIFLEEERRSNKGD